MDQVWGAIEAHPRRRELELRLRTRVTGLVEEGERVTGCRVAPEDGGDEREIAAEAVLIAAGGIGGNLDIVRREWPADLGPPPKDILMGSHYPPYFTNGMRFTSSLLQALAIWYMAYSLLYRAPREWAKRKILDRN